MSRKLDQWTTALSAMVLVATLLACKKKAPVPEAPSATAAVTSAVPTPPAATTALTAPTDVASAAAAPDGSKLGQVKRYPDKEKPQTGAAKVLQDDVKVYGEADNKTDDVASLDKGLLVFRLASLPDWELVEIPAGVGKLAPGWIEAKFLDTQDSASVAREAVATQTKTATVKSAAPKGSATPVASGSAKAAASSSAKAAASSSAKPSASAVASAANAAAAAASAAAAKAAAAAKVAAKNAAKTASKP